MAERKLVDLTQAVDAEALAHRPENVYASAAIRFTKETSMKLKVLALCLALGQAAAVAIMAEAEAASANGPAALALAGVVASHSSVLGSFGRRRVARLFDGTSAILFPNPKISVVADSIVCKASTVDITSRSCELTFGAGKRTLKGRAANELYATLVAAGVATEGAAGSTVASVTMLDCTLDPNEIKQKAGGGAECSFMTGQ
jgi:hypothetical protein